MRFGLDDTLSAGGPVDTALLNTLVLALPPVLIVSMFTYFLIERPFPTLRGEYIANRREC